LAGRGPAPKDPRDRARSNSPPIPWRIVNTPPSPQPPLPATMPDGSEWPERTRQWWAMWGRDPRTADYHSTDWAMLLDTAVLHALFWRGNTVVLNVGHLGLDLRGGAASRHGFLIALSGLISAVHHKSPGDRPGFVASQLVSDLDGSLIRMISLSRSWTGIERRDANLYVARC
jgi:hypothetical protein